VRRAGDVQAAAAVHVDNLGEIRRGQVHRPADAEHAGGADDVVEATEAGGRRGDVPFDVGVVADIEARPPPVDGDPRARPERRQRPRAPAPPAAARAAGRRR